MDPLIQAHRQELLSLVRKYGVGRLLVFGSMARGDASPQSDVDLLVESASQLSGFELGAMQMDAQDILGRKVDLVTQNAIHPLLQDRVMKEAVPIS